MEGDKITFVTLRTMNARETARRYVLLCLLLVASGFSSIAQTVFSANVSANRIGVRDQLQVDYTIENAENLRTITRPNFKDFEVVGGPYQRQSSNVSIVGNKMVQSQSYTHSYILKPKRTGTLVIPPASAKDAEGHQFESNSLNIQVVDGSLAQQHPRQQRNAYDPFDDPFGVDPFEALIQQQRQAMQAMMQRRQQQIVPQGRTPQVSAPDVANMDDVYKNLFIKVDVDKTKAYVGEQITASYKLYARIPMNVNISKLPSLNGFWTQDFELPNKGAIQPKEEIINGKKYQVFLLKKSALFPQQTGTLTLDPAEARGNARIVQQVKQRNPFADDPFLNAFGSSLMMSDPFFNDDFFSSLAYRDVPVELKSTPVKITVLPVPENGKPEGYTGAVGQFSVKGTVDKSKVTTDDALTYTLTVTGTGNLKLIQPPTLKLPNGLTTYDPQVVDTITGRTTAITGSKIITYTLSANTPGTYTIPAIPFSYYNTASGKYTTLYTEPVKLTVEKGKGYKPTIAQKQAITDLLPNATTPITSLKPRSKPLFLTVGYWSMYALPMLAFIGMIVWRRRDDELQRDVVKLRHRQANKVAIKRLKTAEQFLKKGNRQPFYEEVSKAIWLYLSDKLNIPLSALSRERADEALSGRNIDPSLHQQLRTVIDDCEMALYMPGSGTADAMQRSFAAAADTISKLEQNL